MGQKKSKPTKALCVGLDNAGKSTVINFFKPVKEKSNEMHPTVGFMVEQFKYASCQFQVFDMSGAGRYRKLWEDLFKDAEAFIWVIDSADRLRMCVVKDELEILLNHKDICTRPVPVLFYANKMDLPKALTAAEIAKLLELDKIKNRNWQIVESNALTGTGLSDAKVSALYGNAMTERNIHLAWLMRTKLQVLQSSTAFEDNQSMHPLWTFSRTYNEGEQNWVFSPSEVTRCELGENVKDDDDSNKVKESATAATVPSSEQVKDDKVE